MSKKLIFPFLLFSLFILSKNKKNLFSDNKDIRKLREEDTRRDDIIILHTNDVHCGLIDSIGYDGLMLYKKELEMEYKNVLLVDAGDHIQGGAIGLLSNGSDIIDIMNKIGYNVTLIGNHEFDYGIDNLIDCDKKLVNGYISANFCLRKEKNKNSIFPAYKILDVGNKKIAFIGVTTPQTLSKTYLHNILDEDGQMKYDFLNGNNGQELYEKMQYYINKVRGEGADYVIILSHLGNAGDALEQFTSSGLLSHLSGVDAMIDGHTHKVYNITTKDKYNNPIPLSQTGTKLTHLGVLKIKTDGTITSELLSEIPTPKYYKPMMVERNGVRRFVDPEMNSFINIKINSHSAQLNEKIGYSDYDLLINLDNSGDSSRQISRSEESTLCDLVADAIRDIGNGDICMINAGSIRADLKKGDITLQNVLDILPFSSDIVIKEVYGSDILDALEFGMKYLPNRTSRFPQVSGISFKVDLKIKSPVIVDDEEMFVKVQGERRVFDVKVGGKKIETNKKYRLSFDNYIASGGDGFSMFNKYEEISNVLKTDNEAFTIYIKDKLRGIIPDIYREVQGRIVIGDKNSNSFGFYFSKSRVLEIILLITLLL